MSQTHLKLPIAKCGWQINFIKIRRKRNGRIEDFKGTGSARE